MILYATNPDLRTALEHLIDAHGLRSVLEDLSIMLQEDRRRHSFVPDRILDVASKLEDAARMVP